MTRTITAVPGETITVYGQQLTAVPNKARTRYNVKDGRAVVPPPVDPPVDPTVPHGAFRSDYFENMTLTGTPKAVAEVISIAIDWQGGGPTGVSLTDGWSDRHTGLFDFTPAPTS